MFTTPPPTVTSVAVCAKTVASISAMRFMRGVHARSTRSVLPMMASTRVCLPAGVRLKATALGNSTSASGSSMSAVNWLASAGGRPKPSRRLVTSPSRRTNSFNSTVTAPLLGNHTRAVPLSRTSLASPVLAVKLWMATSSPKSEKVWFVPVLVSTSVAVNSAAFSRMVPL